MSAGGYEPRRGLQSRERGCPARMCPTSGAREARAGRRRRPPSTATWRRRSRASMGATSSPCSSTRGKRSAASLGGR
eukprot:777196-Pyramimonas_sp.AAC.1